MKKNTFKILFHIRGNYKNKEGKCPITIRIAVNGEYERINSTVAVEPELWDVKAMKAIGRSAKILEKYEGKYLDGQLMPIITNQKLNCYLKEIADICGIEKNLTFHLARHTFATTMTLGKGVPIESVSKMLGHTNIQTTQIYARITNEKISHDMDNLAKNIGSLDFS